MSRLIDAKELINNRPENLNPRMSDEIKSAYNEGWNTCNSFWFSLIENSPTAYDIDKVVERLEEHYSCDVGALKMISLDKVVEMVKRGAE